MITKANLNDVDDGKDDIEWRPHSRARVSEFASNSNISTACSSVELGGQTPFHVVEFGGILDLTGILD